MRRFLPSVEKIAKQQKIKTLRSNKNYGKIILYQTKLTEDSKYFSQINRGETLAAGGKKTLRSNKK